MAGGDCLERQRTEADALKHIFGDECVRSAFGLRAEGDRGAATISVTTNVERGTGEAITLRLDFRLPPDYPEQSEPDVSVSCAELPRDQLGRLQSAATAFAANQFASGEGQECIYETVLHVQDAAAALAGGQPGSRKQAADVAAVAASAPPPEHKAVVHIDHMNDPSSYTALLQRWAGQLSLRGEMFLRRNGSRATGVVLVLGGAEDSIQGFCKRLRTEYVDVNSKGEKCKERKSNTLCSFLAPCNQQLPGESGLVMKEYATTDELHAHLQSLDVLEVWLTKR